MNKQELLNNINGEDDKLLASKILDKIEFARRKNSVQTTDFLDIHQNEVAKKVLNAVKCTNYTVYGGYEDAERTMLVIYPEKLETVFLNNQYDFNNVCQILRIILPNEMRGKYSHRDYLGAIIKVGIKREKIGDIIVSIDGADIIASKDIINSLKLSLEELTRFSKSTFEIHKMDEINISAPKIEIANVIVPSMRVDSIVSEVIRTSRAKAIEIINQERVFVNGETILKNSKMLKEQDKITVRGKGRFEISNILNTTKKGNLVVEIKKYV